MAPQIFRVRFLLTKDTIGIVADTEGKGTIMEVPSGATIAVMDALNETGEPNRRVEVQWLGKTLDMFAADILERGVKV